MKIRPNYLRLTEEINSLDYLEHAVVSLYETEKRKIAWKWVVIGLHGALYGFAICACQGTDPNNVLTKSGKLIDFDSAIMKCKDPNWMSSLAGGQSLVLNKSQERSIISLKNTLRNNFQHYKPMGWSIEIHGMPAVALDILKIIYFLALKTGTYIHLRSVDKKRIRSLIHQATIFIKRSKLYREALLRSAP